MYPIDWYLIEIKATSKYVSCNKLNRNNEAHTIITPIFKRFALGENQYLNERIKAIIVKGYIVTLNEEKHIFKKVPNAIEILFSTAYSNLSG